MQKAQWGAIYSLAFGYVMLTISQSIPVSLIPAFARDLQISEGFAGQTVTATSALAFVTSVVIASVARNMDRRGLYLVLAVTQVVANVLVAVAPNVWVLLLARMVLGVAVGALWSLAAAMSMRLVPPADVARAMSIVFGAGTIANVAAVPIGSMVEALVGWRVLFGGLTALTVVVAVWQARVLPAMPTQSDTRLDILLVLLRQRRFAYGMVAVLLAFTGYFAFFTYLRPFLEGVTQADVGQFSIVVLGSGLASVVGAMLAVRVLGRDLGRALIAMPALVFAATVGVMFFGTSLWVVAALVAVIGWAFSIIPVGWTTWVTQVVPTQAEAGGGGFVATTQLAITIGAALGGAALDGYGPMGAVVLGAMFLGAALPVTYLAMRAPAGAA